MSVRHWRRVIELIEKNPVLCSRVKYRDVDRLFYAATHSNGKVTQRITCRQFKALLSELSESMGVSASFVFLAVGSHADCLRESLKRDNFVPVELQTAKRSSSVPATQSKKQLQPPGRRQTVC